MAERITAPGKQPKARVTAKVKLAIDAMVFEALPRREAAAKASLLEHSLYKALRKPPTLAYLRAQMEVLRTSAGAEAVARIVQLMHGADSEHVQLEAAKWTAGIEGVSPVAKSESVLIHRNLMPGLVIVTGGFQPHDCTAIEQGRVIEHRHPINRIGEPAPHPEAEHHPMRSKARAE